MSDGEVVLSVRDLEVSFATKRGRAHVVRGLDYDLHRGETLALVGESGSGKSVSTLALTRLIPVPPGRISGSAELTHADGTSVDLLALDERALLRERGRHVGFVFQDPMTSLNPVHTIGRQLTEGMRWHLGLSDTDARARAVELLDQVGIPNAKNRLDDYPHQFSGGMRQRVVIAIGLSCDPDVLVADEATTALDVTTQAQITDLVARLQDELGMAVIWITHDLGVVAGIADRVLVLYAGEVVEEATTDDLFAAPKHPYTTGLLASLPVLGAGAGRELTAIPGLPPAPTDLPAGCAFHPRCAFRSDERCADQRPPLRDVVASDEGRRSGASDEGRRSGASDEGRRSDGRVHRVRSFYEVDPETARRVATAGIAAEGGDR